MAAWYRRASRGLAGWFGAPALAPEPTSFAVGPDGSSPWYVWPDTKPADSPGLSVVAVS